MNDYKSLFLKQSYEDSWHEYEKSLNNADYIYWDYVVLTASNDNQAKIFSAQLDARIKGGFLPKKAKYIVIADPNGKRVGSGGATLNVIKHISQIENKEEFSGMRILIIHSGGDSKRIPQYSACGKIFSPVPRMLPDGRRSTIFDEFVISLSDVPARIPSGVFVASGDVLLLFNSLQIDFCTKGAAAITFKSPAQTGSHHGVYLADDDGNVKNFLHKKSVEELSARGAVDKKGNVCIDTGAVILDDNIVNDMLKLIKGDNFERFVNDNVRLNFYGDFLFPMASESDYESYLKETPENEFSPELDECRKELWNLLNKYRIKLMNLSPASFIHFGTTAEILKLLDKDMKNYSYLGWTSSLNTNSVSESYYASNSFIESGAVIGDGTYIEDSYIGKDCKIGKNCVVSCVNAENITVPDNTVLHALKLNDGRFNVRKYGVLDNPKENYVLGKKLPCPLWESKIHPVCDTIEEACCAALNEDEGVEKINLKEGFERADGGSLIEWQDKILAEVEADCIIRKIESETDMETVKKSINFRTSERTIKRIVELSDNLNYSTKMRIFYFLSEIVREDKDFYTKKCFGVIKESISKEILKNRFNNMLCPVKDKAECFLPVRVNWGGGWSDTPPYCNEHGGRVLNAAIELDDKLPIRAYVEKNDCGKIVLACKDNGAVTEFSETALLQDLSSPFDSFAIQKAAMIVLGIIPEKECVSFDDIIRHTGGFTFTTSVINIPRGSGLGTSSILAGACVKAAAEYFGISLSDKEVCTYVMCMEQLMSTGGGWQDQMGGLEKGIKMITSEAGLFQNVEYEKLVLSNETKDELDKRFCLIYSGQRRLARNLLRNVLGRYISGNPQSIDAFINIQKIAVQMQETLINGDIDKFADLLNLHWEYSKILDKGCTNTCIEQIFNVCDDMIDGKMICGAGGGGFMQVILKKGVSKQMLNDRLLEVFGDSGVKVWNSRFFW